MPCGGSGSREHLGCVLVRGGIAFLTNLQKKGHHHQVAPRINIPFSLKSCTTLHQFVCYVVYWDECMVKYETCTGM